MQRPPRHGTACTEQLDATGASIRQGCPQRSFANTRAAETSLSLKVKKARLPHLSRAIISADTLGVSWFSKHIFTTSDDLRSGPGYRIEDTPGLTVFPARELSDLSDLADLAPSLRELKLEGCKEIDRIDVLADLVNLDYLDIADCARVESVAPLARMRELTAFYAWGGARIVDADLSPLLKLTKLADFRMRDRKEYRPSVAEIHATISSRA
jgi:hypothetical protein